MKEKNVNSSKYINETENRERIIKSIRKKLSSRVEKKLVLYYDLS